MPSRPPPVSESQSGPEVLLAILTDLATDHRCYKVAKTLKRHGARPRIYCDRPRHALGPAWAEFDVHVLTRASHFQSFFPVFVAFLARLLPVLLRTRARVWISLDAPPLFWLAFWGKLRGRQVVYDSHELFLETPLVLNRPSRRLFWWLWEGGGFALISRCVTVSPAIVEKLKARYPSHRFYLLPNMPYLEAGPEPARPPLSQGLRLVFQGGLRLASGLPELFRAMKTRLNIRLEIFGAGPEEEKLRAAARAEGVAGATDFRGVVPFEELPEKLASAHIGIHLMQPVCGSFALTWANKIFDYVHAGLPVLLSDNPAHAALLREFRVGVMVDSFSPDAIGRGLDALAAEYESCRGECARARRLWHWEERARDLPAFLGL